MFLNKGISVALLFLVFVCATAAQTDIDNGIASYELGRYENAKTIFLKAVENDKEDREALRFLGITYARLGMHDLAVKTLIEADQIRIYGKKPNPDDDKNYKRAKLLPGSGSVFSGVPRKDRLQGKMKVVAVVNENGDVTFVYAYQELNEAMTESAIKYTYKFKFEPAEKNGKTITDLRTIEYHLSIM